MSTAAWEVKITVLNLKQSRNVSSYLSFQTSSSKSRIFSRKFHRAQMSKNYSQMKGTDAICS